MSKHTPGPWILCLDAPYPIVQRGRTGGFQVMAPNPSIALADARLIAAAPELLEALHHCNATLHILSDENPDAIINDAMDHALAAIAKATGEPQ